MSNGMSSEDGRILSNQSSFNQNGLNEVDMVSSDTRPFEQHMMKDERTPGKIQQNDYDNKHAGGMYVDTNTLVD